MVTSGIDVMEHWKTCYDSQQQYANSGSRVQLARHPSENPAREKWQSSTLEE